MNNHEWNFLEKFSKDFNDINNMPGSLSVVAHYPSPTRQGKSSNADDIAGQSSHSSLSQRSRTVPGEDNYTSRKVNFEDDNIPGCFPLAGPQQ